MKNREKPRQDRTRLRRLGAVTLVAAMTLTLGCRRPPAVDARSFKVADVDAMGDVSGNGRLMTYVDWTTGNLALRDLASGQDRHLTDKGTWEESSAWAEYSLISPDGARVVYSWHREDGVYDLRLLETEDPAPSVLLAGDGSHYLAPRDWSRDGRQILANRIGENRERETLLISVPEGGVRTLNALSGANPGKAQFSPDGRFVAHDTPGTAARYEHDIHLLAVPNGRGTPLVESPEDERILGWSPDGGWILFFRQTGSRPSLWRVRVSDGRPVAEPEIVLDEIGQEIIESLGFTESGDWYHGIMEWTDDLYLATLDASSERLASPSRVVTRMAANSSADWSPDGRFLAWIEAGGLDYRPLALLLREVESGEETRWPVAGKGRHGHRPRWTADGRSIVLDGQDAAYEAILLAIDAQTGSPRELAELASTCVDECVAWALDGASRLETLWTSKGLTTGTSIERQTVSSESLEEIYRAPESSSISRMTLSPDRRWLAFVVFDATTRSTRLALLPASGGPLRELLDLGGIESHYSSGGTRIAWSRDSSFLLLGRSSTREESPVEIWYVPVDSGSPVQLSHALPEPRLYGISLHPDGRTVALSLGKRRRYEVWKLVGAIPD